MAMADTGVELNAFGTFCYTPEALAAEAASAAFAAEQYCRRRNMELASNAHSGLDAAADLPPNR
jgi:hypothetical protein